MTTVEGDTSAGATVGRDRHRPGSTTSRLAKASRQLEIVLEAVDLEEEPEFGGAVIDAIEAVHDAATHAHRLSDDGAGENRSEESFEWGGEET